MGWETYNISPNLAARLDLPVERGIVVYRVVRGGTAEAAGLRGATAYELLFNRRFPVGGDVVTEIDGKPIGSGDDVDLVLEARRPGDSVGITYYRGGTRYQKSIVLMEQPRRSRF
jgi:S1-C subfamily serine protease